MSGWLSFLNARAVSVVAALAGVTVAMAAGPVFRNARGGRLTTRSVARLMARYALASATTAKGTPHTP